MRATTLSRPKVSRATRAAMMLELSPDETAAKACARSMPASSRVSRSKPMPVTLRPAKSADNRRNALASRSITATECPSVSRLRARAEPTRPQPMITTCTAGTLHAAAPAVRSAAVPAASESVELELGSPAAGGACVARAADGRVVFVRHGLPGERVRAVVTSETAHFLRADAVEVLSASPDRVVPPCPYAGPGRCGGCDFQHVELSAQRGLKAQLVEEQLRRVAKVERAVVVEPVAGDEDGLRWRTRIQLAVDARSEERRVGRG